MKRKSLFGVIICAIALITQSCDDDFNEILGTQKNYEIYREGILSFDGKINLSEEIKRDLDF